MVVSRVYCLKSFSFYSYLTSFSIFADISIARLRISSGEDGEEKYMFSDAALDAFSRFLRGDDSRLDHAFSPSVKANVTGRHKIFNMFPPLGPADPRCKAMMKRLEDPEHREMIQRMRTQLGLEG